MKTGKIEPPVMKSGASPRSGNRHTKTRKRTAHACGKNYEPTGSWSSRSQGLESVTTTRRKKDREMKKQATAVRKGDTKGT